MQWFGSVGNIVILLILNAFRFYLRWSIQKCPFGATAKRNS
jgi:hypothetical protein